MNETVFDAMLKTALEEALRRDIAEAPGPPGPSRRQRRRMRALLAEPRCAAGGPQEAEDTGRPRIPTRWLAIAILAALLTGTAAAGLTQGDGAWFRRRFEASPWAGDYDTAADIGQLSDLGAEMNTTLAESGGLRFEMLDAVYDGQTALIAVRMTVLDPALLERLQKAETLPSVGLEFQEAETANGSYGYRIEDGPEKGQYSLEISVTGETLNSDGRYSFRITALALIPLGGGDGEILRQGEWTLTVTPQPIEPLILEPKRVFQVNGVDWMLDKVVLSPLTLRLSSHCMAAKRQALWSPWEAVEIHMKDGEVVDSRGCSGGSNNGGYTADAGMSFPVPLNLEQAAFLRVWGQDIYLEE